jgi:hypothetical protein
LSSVVPALPADRLAEEDFSSAIIQSPFLKFIVIY